MTEAQRNKAIRVIQADAELRHKYCNEAGQTCAIGGLLKAAGYDMSLLTGENNATPIDGLGLALRALEAEYGLNRDQAFILQQINDKHPDIVVRRLALIEYLVGRELDAREVSA